MRKVLRKFIKLLLIFVIVIIGLNIYGVGGNTGDRSLSLKNLSLQTIDLGYRLSYDQETNSYPIGQVPGLVGIRNLPDDITILDNFADTSKFCAFVQVEEGESSWKYYQATQEGSGATNRPCNLSSHAGLWLKAKAYLKKVFFYVPKNIFGRKDKFPGMEQEVYLRLLGEIMHQSKNLYSGNYPSGVGFKKTVIEDHLLRSHVTSSYSIDSVYRFVDNTDSPDTFCIWYTNGTEYITVSPKGIGKSPSSLDNPKPSLDNCGILEVPRQNYIKVFGEDYLNNSDKLNSDVVINEPYLVSAVKRASFVYQKSKDHKTGEYPTSTSQFVINEEPSDRLVFLDNSKIPDRYCVFAKLIDDPRGEYYVATEIQSNYSDTPCKIEGREERVLKKAAYYREEGITDESRNLGGYHQIKNAYYSYLSLLDKETGLYPAGPNPDIPGDPEVYLKYVTVRDNSDDPSKFCVYTKIYNDQKGEYYYATENGLSYGSDPCPPEIGNQVIDVPMVDGTLDSELKVLSDEDLKKEVPELEPNKKVHGTNSYYGTLSNEDINKMIAIRDISYAYSISFSDITGEYPTGSDPEFNESAKINQELISLAKIVDNSKVPFRFCAYAELEDATYGSYYTATHVSTGHSDSPCFLVLESEDINNMNKVSFSTDLARSGIRATSAEEGREGHVSDEIRIKNVRKVWRAYMDNKDSSGNYPIGTKPDMSKLKISASDLDGVIFYDNTDNPKEFCFYTELKNSDFYIYERASHFGSGLIFEDNPCPLI